MTLILCTTPRSGSTLVCALIEATGVAGRPESWYRAESRASYARNWGLTPDASGQIPPAAYLAAAIRAGQSPNGVAGLRLQAQSLSDCLTDLRKLHESQDTDLTQLTRAFGPCRFEYIYRRDDVAQAISRLKAEVTQVWHLDGTEKAARALPRYDAARLDAYREEIAAGQTLWSNWFTANRVTPETLLFEDFTKNPAATVAALLPRLGLPSPDASTLKVPNRRMPDGQSAAWAARYRAERGLRA